MALSQWLVSHSDKSPSSANYVISPFSLKNNCVLGWDGGEGWDSNPVRSEGQIHHLDFVSAEASKFFCVA